MGLFRKFIIFSVILACTKASEWDNRTATIAVVEYQPVLNSTLSPDERILANTDQYVKFIKDVQDLEVDLIVFPEATLHNDPSTAVEVLINTNPCDSPDSVKFVSQLSCATRDSNTYLVVNLVEKEKCNNNGSSTSKNCQNDGFFYYNTDVVFDRQGKIVARYRKYNLFGEYELDRPSTAEEVVIETDFGVRYGIFTCFDILFKTPAQDLLKKNIDGVIFPTMWFSELPFLTALQTQQMWAHAHDVKVFAAGANQPLVGSGGSGIYSGSQGMIVADIIATGGSQLYIYKYVTGEPPKDYNPQEPMNQKDTDVLAKEMDGFFLKTDRSIKQYTSKVINAINGVFTEPLCYGNGTENELCCEFSIKITTNKDATKNTYVYHLVAFSGIRSFDGTYNGGLEVCAILACLNTSLSSCGQRFPNYDDVEWITTFDEIKIKANFEKSENRTQYPNSLLSSIRPINASQTVWEEKEVQIDGKTMIERTFSTTQPQDRLLTFAIFGRNFEQDSAPDDDDDKDSVKSINASWFLIISGVILSILAIM